jgi:hypothetical protein
MCCACGPTLIRNLYLDEGIFPNSFCDREETVGMSGSAVSATPNIERKINAYLKMLLACSLMEPAVAGI